VLSGLGGHALAIQAGRDGLARARELGFARHVAAPIAGNLAESLTCAGHWDEALEILEEILSLELPPLGRVHALLGRTEIALGRGDLGSAERSLSELRALPAGVRAESHYALPLAQLEIEYLLAVGDLTGALAAARALPAFDPHAPRYQWPLLTIAMRVCAEVIGVGPRPGAADPAELRKDLESQAAQLSRLSPLQDAHAAEFAAELSRADGRKDLPCWDTAAAAWEAVSQPWPLAYALARAAAIAAAAGDRDEAASRLQRAAVLAGQLRAQPLQEQISQLARRARIQLTSPGSDAATNPAAPYGLTGREQEVLQLIAAGRTNREIAAELFISPSTASVHVSNILGKLGAATRGEAAAAAHRLHLISQP